MGPHGLPDTGHPPGGKPTAPPARLRRIGADRLALLRETETQPKNYDDYCRASVAATSQEGQASLDGQPYEACRYREGWQ